MRRTWGTYYNDTHAVVLVVDSDDRQRIAICKDELHRLLKHSDLRNAVILIFANKQDLKTAMSVTEISDYLALHTIKVSLPCQE